MNRLIMAGALVLALVGATPAHAEERKCYPLATLKLSFRVVFPNAKQIVMDGAQASIYLDAYNGYGKKTDYKGDVLLVNVLPDGTALVVPLENDMGCKRVVVGPKLHKIIMAKIARGAA